MERNRRQAFILWKKNGTRRCKARIQNINSPHLMPILIGDYHLLNNLFDILVSSFYRTIHLWSIWRRVGMLDFPFNAEFYYHLAIEILGIISYNLFWWTIPTYQISLNKFLHHFLCHIATRITYDHCWLLGLQVHSHQFPTSRRAMEMSS